MAAPMDSSMSRQMQHSQQAQMVIQSVDNDPSQMKMKTMVPTSMAAQQQAQLLLESDPVHKVKHLLPNLKESLANLMRVAGQSLQVNSSEEGMKSSENLHQKFEKCLEEFYVFCDQIESALRLAVEGYQQTYDNHKYSPFVINIPKENNQWPDGQTVNYSQFMATMKLQVNSAKELHDLLVDHARKLTPSGTN